MNPTTLARALIPRGKLAESQIGPLLQRARLLDKPAQDYAAWLQVPDSPLPLTWLYPWVQPLHIAALLEPSLRIPVLGMVHAGNTVARIGRLPPRPEVALELREIDPIAGRRALELRTLFHSHDGPAAAMLSTYLLRAKAREELTGRAAAPTFDSSWPDEAKAIAWPSSAGRTYARLSGDYNPIHLASPLARLFGQRGAILHGMAMAAVAWRDTGAQAAYQEITFRRPLVLPGVTRTAFNPANGHFAIQGDDGTRHALGRHGEPSEAEALVTSLAADLDRS